MGTLFDTNETTELHTRIIIICSRMQKITASMTCKPDQSRELSTKLQEKYYEKQRREKGISDMPMKDWQAGDWIGFGKQVDRVKELPNTTYLEV
jgi:hypothetical protein